MAKVITTKRTGKKKPVMLVKKTCRKLRRRVSKPLTGAYDIDVGVPLMAQTTWEKKVGFFADVLVPVANLTYPVIERDRLGNDVVRQARKRTIMIKVEVKQGDAANGMGRICKGSPCLPKLMVGSEARWAGGSFHSPARLCDLEKHKLDLVNGRVWVA